MSTFYADYPVTGGGGSGVTSLDGMTGALTLVAGSGITIVDGSGTITISSSSSSSVTLTSFGSAPNADGASLSGQALTLQPASASFPGGVSTATQSFAGNKTFTGSISAANLSGTNTGDITLGTADGLSLSAQILSLALSSTSTTGALSSTDWNTFNGKFTLPALTAGSILFSDGSTIAQDNANFFWDNTTKVLSVGSNTISTNNPSFQVIQNPVDPANAATTIDTEMNLHVTADSTATFIGQYNILRSKIDTGVSLHGAILGNNVGISRQDAADLGSVDFAVGYFSQFIQGNGAKHTGEYAGYITGFHSIDASGTIDTMYDFQAMPSSIPAAVVTNRYGIYLSPDTNYTKINWLSGRTLLGGSSFVTPTADLHLPGVTTAASTASLKIDSGTLMTTPENGAIESDGTDLWWTDNTSTRISLSAGGGGGGANQSLSNLTSPTAINQDLTFNKASPLITSGTDPSLTLQTNSGNDFSGILGVTNLMSSTIGANTPAIVFDGTTTAALSAFAVALVLNANDSQSEFYLVTADQATADTSSGINIQTGQNTNIGNSGGVAVFSGNATGASGNTGNLLLTTGTSNNGISGQVNISSGGATASGNVTITTGTSAPGNSGNLNLHTADSASSGMSGNISISPGTVTGTGGAGNIDIEAGSTGVGGTGTPGTMTIRGGSSAVASIGSQSTTISGGQGTNGASGGIVYINGGTSDTGNTGNIQIATFPSSATRGKIQLQDGTEGTSGYVWKSIDTVGTGSWAASTASTSNAKDTFVLSGTDITNQFVTLSNTPVANSVDLLVKGSGVQLEGASYDYTVSGNTIVFQNDLATGGVSALVAGDVLQVQYEF